MKIGQLRWIFGLFVACGPEPGTPTPEPVQVGDSFAVKYVYNSTHYCEYYIEGTTFGSCGGVTMDDDGTYRGVAYDDLTYWMVEEEMVLEEVSLRPVSLEADVATMEVAFVAQTLPGADVPFSVRVEGELFVPWTEFLSRTYPHGDEPYYFVFGTMWVEVLGFERELIIDDQPDYPDGGWGWSSEVAINHVP